MKQFGVHNLSVKKADMMIRGAAGILLIAVLGLLIPDAQACRYSIRDVSFVDLEPEPYKFYWLGSDRREVIERSLSAASRAILTDSNLGFVSGTPPDNIVSTDGSGILIISPDGRSLEVGVGEVPDKDVEMDSWALGMVRELVASPVRNLILEKAIDRYAVILVAEGTDGSENRRVAEAAKQSVREIDRLLPRMPKPVENGPELIVVPHSDKAGERIAMWAMGMDADKEDVQACVISGRGRRVGPPLTGGLVTRTALLEHLVIVGQDCECELDRSWMQGPMMPVDWDRNLRRQAFDALGFDTENPMVKSEMSRIIARGPNADTSAGVREYQPAGGFDDLMMGYQEIDIASLDNGNLPGAEITGSEDAVGEVVYRSGMTVSKDQEADSETQSSSDPIPEPAESESNPAAGQSASTISDAAVEVSDEPAEISGVWTLLSVGILAAGTLVAGLFILTRGRP